MKRKPRVKQQIKFYETEPVIPGKKIANKPLVQNASLANTIPKMVPRNPGANSAFGGLGHKSGRKPQGGVKVPVASTPKLRLSGHPSAHHLGKR